MRKIHLLLTTLMLIAFSVGTAWAGSYSLTPNQATTGSESTKYITTLTEFTHNSITWKMNQWNPSSLQVKTNQSSATAEFRFYNTSAFPGKITKVVITFKALTISNPDETGFMFVGGTSEVSGTTGGTNGVWDEDNKTITWEPASTDNFTYFAFYQDGKKATSSNYLAESDAIVVTYADGGSSTTPSISVKQKGSAITEIDFGNVVEDTQDEDHGKAAVQTFDIKGANLTDKVKLEISSTHAMKIYVPGYASPYFNNLTLTPKNGAIDTTITITSSTIGTGEKTGVLTVSSLTSTADFTAINIDLKINLLERVDPTSVALNKTELAMEVGDEETLVATVSPENATNKKVKWQSSNSAVADVDENGKVTAVGEGTCTIRCYAEENYYTYKSCEVTVSAHTVKAGTYTIDLNKDLYGVAKGNNETEQSASQNDITIVSGCESYASNKTYYDDTHIRYYMDSYLKLSAPTGFVITEVVFTAGGTWNGYFTVNAGEYDKDTKKWTGSTSEVIFSFTSQNRIASIKVTYAAASEIALPNISGQTPFYPSTTVTMTIDTDGADIIYTMNGEDPLGGDNTYSQPIVLTETKTIKARGFKGVKLGEVASKTFTKATPISVTDAIAAIPNENDAVDNAFVYGYVCTLSESDPNANGQMTYYISKDGTETNRLQIYKGKGLNNAAFASKEDIALGDKVVIYGQLKNYGGTYEMNSGNYIVEKVAKGDVQSVVISGDATHGAYEGGDAFDPAGLKVTATYASGYQEDVTASATWSPATITTQSGNTDVTATFGGKTSDAKTVNITLNKYTVTFNTSVYGGTWGIKKGDNYIKTGNYFPKGTVLTVVTEAVAGYKLGSITVNDAPLEGNEITIGTENITVAVEFAMIQEGVLVLSTNSLNWGSINVGTKPQDVPYQTFTLTGGNLTQGRTVKLTAPTWCYLTQTTANPTAGGNIATTSFYVYVKDATLETAGEYSGNIVISSDDLAKDSLVAVKLTVTEKKDGKLTLSKNVVDFGASKIGSSIASQSFKLSGTGFTPNGTISLAFAGDNKDYFGLMTNSYTADANGAISEKNVEILVDETAYATYGVRDCQLKISSDDLTSDSIVTIKLTVGGVVSTTPSPVALDLGDVLNNDNPSLYGKTFHIKITNLSANKQARVVPSTASFSVEPYYIIANADGVIDRDVTILPYLNGGGAAVYNANLEVVCSGTREFNDIKVGTVTMNLLEAYKVIVPEISNGSLSWDGGTAPQAARPGTTHTLVATPASGYEGGTIQILKNSDDSDITEDVLDGSTLTMPSYNIKVVVSGFKQSAKPSLPMSWKYETYTLTFGEFKEPALYSSLKINDNLKSTYGDQIVITSSNTNVATYTSKYSEYQCYTVYNSIVGAGTTIFTAYFAGDDTYGETTVTYTLTVNKADAGLAWSANAATVKYGASNNVFPTLSNPNNLTVSYECAPNWIATIDSNGAITIVNVGEATITAKFAGNSNYNAQTVEYTLTIEKGIPGYEYQINGSKVEDVYVTYGAKDNVFPTLVKPEDFGVNYKSSNTAVAAINTSGTIYLYKAGTTTIKACFWGTSQWEPDTATFVLHVAKGTPKLEWNAQYTQIVNGEVTVDIYDSADGRQLPHLNSDAPDGVVITSNNESVVKINETFKYPVLQYETGDAIVTASFAENDQYNAKSISYTVHAVDNIRYESNLQWRIGTEQVSSASVTLAGNDNVFPTLYNPRGVTPTYSSSNENVATISNGTITLVGAGTTTITASFDGNYSYKPSTATYTLTVNAVANISVGGVSSIDFGTVNKGASVDEQSFTLTGSNLTGNVKVTVATEGSTTAFVTNGFRPSNTFTPTDGAINASVVVIPYTSNAGNFNGSLTIHSLTDDFEDIVIPLHIWVKAKPTITLEAGTQVHMTVKNGNTVINSGDAVEEGTVLTVEISMGSTSWKLTSLTAGGVDIMESRQFTVGTTNITVVATSDMKEDSDITWSSTEVVYAYTDGSKATVWPTIENPHNIAGVTCRSSNEQVASVDNNGNVTIHKEGQIYIWVEVKNNNDYKDASASYMLRVCAPDHINVSEWSSHQVSYEYGDNFNFNGFKAELYYNNYGGKRDVTEEATWTTDPAAITEDGNITVNATVGAITGSVSNVNVVVSKHTIAINSATHGSIVVMHGDNVVASGDKFVYGTELTVSVTPEEGYELNTLKANGVIIEEGTFIVRSVDVTFTATFKQSQATALDNTTIENRPTKIIRDNKVYILRGDKIYTVEGQLVK